MKLLLDQGLPRSTCNLLSARGIVAEHVSNLGLATATDERILQVARDNDFVVVTLDADFHQLLAITEATAPSTIRIRIEGLRAEPLATILERTLAATTIDLASGAVVSVTASRIRVHRLPIGG